MIEQLLTFDQVFAIWLINEVGSPEEVDYLPVAKEKGFSSVAEWRLATVLRMGLDKKDWHLVEIANPVGELPKIIIGPYQGWSKFFDNKLNTTFEQAMELPNFAAWVAKHDRIPKIANDFPTPTTMIAVRKPNGDFIHIEGGHRMCAVAYANKMNIDLNIQVSVAYADVSDEEIEHLIKFVSEGTFKK